MKAHRLHIPKEKKETLVAWLARALATAKCETHRCLSSKTAHAAIEEESLKKVSCNAEIMCNPGNRTSGSSCSRDVGVGCDWWNVFSASSAVHPSGSLFVLYLQKVWKKSFHSSFNFSILVTNDHPQTSASLGWNPNHIHCAISARCSE